MTGRLPFRRSRDADAAPAPPPGLTVPPHPIGVRLFTADGSGDVEIESGTHRITDVLNAPEPLHIRSAPEKDGEARGAWVEVDVDDRDEIMVVVPPPQDTNPLQRLHRPGQEVSMRIGPYVVSGEAHVPPGSDATGFMLRHRPHFIALTRAVIQQSGEPDISIPVAIVNLRIADSLRDADDAEAGEPATDAVTE